MKRLEPKRRGLRGNESSRKRRARDRTLNLWPDGVLMRKVPVVQPAAPEEKEASFRSGAADADRAGIHLTAVRQEVELGKPPGRSGRKAGEQSERVRVIIPAPPHR